MLELLTQGEFKDEISRTLPSWQGHVFGKEDNRDDYLVGSSNFTAAGLTSNLELNVGRYDPTPVTRGDWFDDLWGRAS